MGRAGRRATLAAVLAAAATLGACEPYVQGNGVFQQEDRSSGLPLFEGISVEDGIRLEVTAAAEPAPQTVVVSGDSNLLRWLRTDVREEVLRGVPTRVLHLVMDVKGAFGPSNPLRAVVAAPTLRFLRARDGSRVAASVAAAPVLDLDAAGGSEVTLAGAGGETLYARLDAASVHADSYPVSLAELALTRGSTVELRAALVSGTADASSRIDGYGGADCQVEGSGKVCCGERLSCP